MAVNVLLLQVETWKELKDENPKINSPGIHIASNY